MRAGRGDLIIAASHITTEKMAWMARYTSERLEELQVTMMASEGAQSDPHRTAFTVSVDYKHGMLPYCHSPTSDSPQRIGTTTGM
ncbi:3,4-dihydroxy-2-butanone 4-phosphate synthase [Moniliophthora roreri]|nr:3,4-dihydroxy-2-butanone 4-phosphate synthase [Moniliophthora roreri]